MSNMRELLSGALPAPEDEPQQRDVIDAAMAWGSRRRRRDLAMTGAAALAILAIGTGVAEMVGGSGSAVSSTSGPSPSETHGRVGILASVPPGGLHQPPWTCAPPPGLTGNPADYCRLLTEQHSFMSDFAKGSAKYIQADLPAGFTVKATDAPILILTGPNGTTNYLYPSTEPASTLDGHMLSCHPPADTPTCVQTSTDGGRAVVNGGPQNAPSAGYVKDGVADPRVDLLVGVASMDGQEGLAPPTARTSLLTDEQLLAIIGDSKLLAYADQQLRHQADISHQIEILSPPSQSDSGSGSPHSSSSGGPTDASSSGSDASSSHLNAGQVATGMSSSG